MNVRRSMPIHRWALIGAVLSLAACSSSPIAPDPVPAASSSVAPAPTPTTTPEPVTHELTGTLTVQENTYVDGDPSSPCVPALSTTSGVSGFEDIDAGAQVTIYDATGAIIATTTLGDGVLVDVTETRQVPDYTDAGLGPSLSDFWSDGTTDYEAANERWEAAYDEWKAALPQINRTYGGGCQFPFAAVVGDAGDFFSVEVAHRGKVNYSRADLEATGWQVELSL